MGGHGHGHGAPYTIPHWSTFKVEGIPQLEELERELAKKNLKDPWIRNEAWRYNPAFGTKLSRARVFFTRGMPLGFGLAVITVLIGKMTEGDDHHGHHHEEEKKKKC